MLVANCADLHARGKDLDAFSKQWNAAVFECEKRGVDLITIAGDVFDKQNIFDRERSTGDIASAVIAPMASTLIPFIVCVGNHDRQNATDLDACAILEGLPNVIVVREAQWIRSVVNVAVVPWSYTESAESLIQRLHDQPIPSPRLLLSHVSVAGAYMNATTVSEGGSFSVTKEFLQDLNFDRIALGDFHKRQELVPGKGGYVGALKQQHHGHSGEPQGFEIWNTDTNEVEWIELDHAPRYETVEWKEGEPRPEPKEGVITKVRTQGWAPSDLETRELEDEGIQVDPIIDKTERKTRVDEIPEGVLGRPRELLGLWANVQTPKPDLEPLYKELEAL